MAKLSRIIELNCCQAKLLIKRFVPSVTA